MTAGWFTQYIKWKIVKITTSIALLRLTMFLKFAPVGTCFFWIKLLCLPCFVFSLRDGWLWIRIFSIRCSIFTPVAWKYVIFLEIKQIIFHVSLTTKGFVFLINFTCLSFDFLQRWVRGLRGIRQNDVSRGNMNTDASPNQKFQKNIYNIIIIIIIIIIIVIIIWIVCTGTICYY